MRTQIIIITALMIAAAYGSLKAQTADYKVQSRTSVISRSNMTDTEVGLVSRIDQPFVGISSGTSIMISSGKTYLNDVIFSLELDNNLLNPETFEEQAAPGEFTLYSNYPNPFNPSTTIRYSLPEKSNVVIKVYKILGQEVCTLVNEEQSAGEKSLVWNGRNSFGQVASTGVYICRIVAGNNSKSIKMLLMK